ncbi:hypothetical protein [Dactylosporangium sp. CA-233914]|uniref:hypothetical protein n=1 Tax=Dactylosporangium sp. CA-233914 TaxID=3239934 RepID=UPI003D8E46EC
MAAGGFGVPSFAPVMVATQSDPTTRASAVPAAATVSVRRWRARRPRRSTVSVGATGIGTLLHETMQAVTPATIDPAGAVAYVAGKTDYIGSAHTENGIVNPGFHVFYHDAAEGFAGLYTVITGKMTLGFHASKAVADAVLGTDLPLIMQPEAAQDTPSGLLAVEPWASPARL